ncbi:MAG: 50S ribosomal protein L10 [Myxococcaceae bacterium]
MLKSEKETVIKELNDKFSRATTAIVAEFGKVDVATVTRLRRKFREGGVEYKVIKNTLARRAAKGTAFEQIADDFVGPVALALGYADVVAPAKILSEFIKDLETIRVKSAVVDGKKVDAKGVEALAKLPGLPELRAKILGMLTQPAAKLVRTIAAPAGQLARVLAARQESLSKAA